MESKLKRTIAILMALCFLISIITAVTSANQAEFDRGYLKGKAQGTADANNGKKAKTNFNFPPSNPPDFNSGYVKGYTDAYYNSGASVPGSSVGYSEAANKGSYDGYAQGCADGRADRQAGNPAFTSPANGGNYKSHLDDPTLALDYKTAYYEAYKPRYLYCYDHP